MYAHIHRIYAVCDCASIWGPASMQFETGPFCGGLRDDACQVGSRFRSFLDQELATLHFTPMSTPSFICRQFSAFFIRSFLRLTSFSVFVRPGDPSINTKTPYKAYVHDKQNSETGILRSVFRHGKRPSRFAVRRSPSILSEKETYTERT